MAAGSFTWFNQALLDLGKKVHDLGADTFRLAIVTGAVVPTAATLAPHFGGAGTTDFAAHQVATNEDGYEGPLSVGQTTWSLLAGVPSWQAAVDSVTIPKDAAGGFADGAYGIVFNDTDADKRALGFFDFGGAKGNTGGPVVIDFDAAAAGATNRIGTLESAA